MTTIAEMRDALGAGNEMTDAQVVEAYVASMGIGSYAAAAEGESLPLDPFELALDAQFHAPGSAEAVFTPADGQPLPEPIRVIRSQPDVETDFGPGTVIREANVFLMRRSEVTAPRKNATLTIGAVTFTLKGEAMLDVEGMTWRMGAVV